MSYDEASGGSGELSLGYHRRAAMTRPSGYGASKLAQLQDEPSWCVRTTSDDRAV